MKYNNISGAEAITLALIEENVDIVFGYPGGANLPIYDSFYNYEKKISHILLRHEQGAVHAAEGYAEASGRVGVCMATSGPGATNLLTGIADAMLDSVPIVCITGQVNSEDLGYDAFQEEARHYAKALRPQAAFQCPSRDVLPGAHPFRIVLKLLLRTTSS